ncbi:glycosyltransferase family 4 protein [Thermomicrobium sp. CFH 73360]|uniref:glycosyltransferase family 4 protein n=1 Tax=Thermomicrobium sp. CFH 73360 TaxID=2951987 RepID=UPI0020775BE0|nr:glycosyltransferase family 1 protein [Thermomicrobium sp. CFH 73360]MCM8747111.1 glycosyltransferase family 4 protein [Thermomicrobium sp. CFH 73360]
MTESIIGIDASRVRAEGITGTERYASRVIEHLLRRPGPYRFRLYRNTRGEFPFPIDRAEIRVIPFPRLWTHVRLAFELVRRPVALLFVPAHILPLWCPVPAVITVHDLGYRYEPQAHPLRQRLYLELGTWWSVRRARRVIAISRATANDLLRFYRAAPERIAVIPHGVDLQFFPRSPQECAAVRHRYGLQRPYLLHVGTLQPRKNLVRLVQAFELLARHDSELELVLVGKRGWLAEPIERAITESPFHGRIRWLGHVDDRDLPALYSAAEVFVFPSLYEGFGLPVLEAMACGIPVVASQRGALKEIAGPALVCDPLDPGNIAEAIAAARQPHQKIALSESGRAYAAQFSWERTAEKTLAVLTAALGAPDASTISTYPCHKDR